MGCGKSKHDVASGNMVSQIKRLSLKLKQKKKKKNIQAEVVPRSETKDAAPETEVSGALRKRIVKGKVHKEKDVDEETKSEVSLAYIDSSGPEVPTTKKGEDRAEAENVMEEKLRPAGETKSEKENVQREPEVVKKGNPIKEEAEAEAPMNEGKDKAELENAVEEKLRPAEETKPQRENVQGEPEVAKEGNPIKEEAVAEAPLKEDEDKAVPENVLGEKLRLAVETKSEKENVQREPEVTEEGNPIQEAAEPPPAAAAEAASVDEAEASNAEEKYENRTPERVVESDPAVSNPRTE